MAQISPDMYTHTVVLNPQEEELMTAFIEESGIKNFSGALRLVINEWAANRKMMARILAAAQPAE